MDHYDHYRYYLERARSCRSMAQRAVDPSIAHLHRDMAVMYENSAAEIASREQIEEPTPSAAFSG